ncbi:MAG: hypothetical protein PHG06_15685 [Parabacteroides sp.]|nr:hypothetical protein [Parabacteroides sp.]
MDTLKSRSEIVEFVSQMCLIDVELVSSNRTSKRAEYVFRDENGIEFTVVNELYFYSFAMVPARHSRIYSDYALRLLDPYIEEIKAMFESIGSSFEDDTTEYGHINNYFSFEITIDSFEKIPDVVTALEKTFKLVPEMPISDTPNIDFIVDGNELYSSAIKFPIIGESAPDWSEVLISIENSMASLYKNERINVEIPHDVLMREPPREFEPVMFVDGDVMKEISMSVDWQDGRYSFHAPVFYGNGGFFVKMIREMGGSYEFITFDSTTQHLKWEIFGNVWETRSTDEGTNITKNGILKQYIGELNNKYDHTLKLFSVNLKHYLRGTNCYNDIEKMYKRIFSMASSTYDEEQMLNAVYEWIKENAEGRHQAYIDSLEGYI